MERIKDFIHDYSDVMLSIAIVAAMVFVVHWNLGAIFHDPSVIVPQGDQRHVSLYEESSEATDEPEQERPDAGERTHADLEPSPPDSEDMVVEAEPVAPEPGTIVTVMIPSGTPGIGIANLLAEHQLIEDPRDFVEAAEAMDLSLRLKSGTYEIPAGSTVEEMVLIISGG